MLKEPGNRWRVLFGSILAIQVLIWGVPSSVLAGLGSSCELVELQVGYPGYRGFVTGVDGVGDHECLQDLEDDDVFFDKRDEDTENRKAAARLGIVGQPDVWTWENWMLIEVERGLSPTCYSCAFASAEDRAEPRGTNIERDDPRLACGELGSDSFLLRWENDRGLNTGWSMQDYQVRAIAMLSSPKGYLNSVQLIDVQNEVLDQLLGEPGVGGSSILAVSWVWDQLVSRGGSFIVPNEVSIDDQIFLFSLGLMAVDQYIADQSRTNLFALLDSAYRDWASQPITMSWKEYLQSIDAEDWV